MSRRILALSALLPALAFPSMARASDASLSHALSSYKVTLTVDIIFLAEDRTVPTKATAGSLASKLSRVQSDMSTVARVARGQKASTSSGRKAQSEALSGFADASASAADGLAAVAAVRAGKSSTAKSDIAAAQSEIAKSIPDFEASGKLLGLFS